MVPYQSNPRFIGRTRFLQTINAHLLDIAPKRFNHRIALYGMGGIGKTQCALAYVYAKRDVYERIYWITAADQTSLLSGYQKIANSAGLDYMQNKPSVEIAHGILFWLMNQKSWLLVIDNLDDMKVVNGLLPENGPQKHTIITTRNPNTLGIPAEPLEVPLLNIAESIELLETFSSITISPESIEREAAKKIIKELQYLPLAIEQAAAYVRHMTGKYSAYLYEYYQDRRYLHKWLPDENRPYSYSIATAWSMSFKTVQETNPQAISLLRLFAFLNPDGILINFMLAGAAVFPDNLRKLLTNHNIMREALLELEKFSLIKWNRENELITIHRLVQRFVADEMSDEESRLTVTGIIDLCLQAFPEFTTNETRSLCRTYQGQIVEPLLHMKTIHSSNSALIRRRVGIFLREDGKYNDSEQLLSQAAEIYKNFSGPDDPDTLMAMHALALTYEAQGRNADAAGVLEQVLETQRRTLGEEHSDTLMTMHYLAWSYRSLDRTKEAAEMQEKVLEVRRRILGEEHVDTLMTMHQLGWSYGWLGRTKEAPEMQETVLEIRRKILGEEHPDTLAVMHSLVMQYNSLGRQQQAAEIGEKVLEARQRILGQEHPLTLHTMQVLAWSYSYLGRKKEAVEILEKVSEASKRVLGEEHPDTIGVMEALNEILNERVLEYSDMSADEILEKVLELSKRVLGEDHSDIIGVLESFSEILSERLLEYSDIPAAERLEKVLEVSKRVLREEHPDATSVMETLIGILNERLLEYSDVPDAEA